MTAKQLPSFGASLETAVSDLDHYQRAGFGTVVLVSSEQRALNLQTLLREQEIRAAVDFQLHDPARGRAAVTLAVGGLSGGHGVPGGCGWRCSPRARQGGRRKSPRPRKTATNRQKLKSYADLSPGDLVVHEHHGIGRYRGHGEDAGGRRGEGLCEDRLRRAPTCSTSPPPSWTW